MITYYCIDTNTLFRRHGAYDFYTEQLAAPNDLKHLTDEHESMAFRRRGEQFARASRKPLQFPDSRPSFQATSAMPSCRR